MCAPRHRPALARRPQRDCARAGSRARRPRSRWCCPGWQRRCQSAPGASGQHSWRSLSMTGGGYCRTRRGRGGRVVSMTSSRAAATSMYSRLASWRWISPVPGGRAAIACCSRSTTHRSAWPDRRSPVRADSGLTANPARETGRTYWLGAAATAVRSSFAGPRTDCGPQKEELEPAREPQLTSQPPLAVSHGRRGNASLAPAAGLPAQRRHWVRNGSTRAVA